VIVILSPSQPWEQVAAAPGAFRKSVNEQMAQSINFRNGNSMTQQKRRKTESSGKPATPAKGATPAPAGQETTPHPAARAATLSPRRGLGQGSAAESANGTARHSERSEESLHLRSRSNYRDPSSPVAPQDDKQTTAATIVEDRRHRTERDVCATREDIASGAAAPARPVSDAAQLPDELRALAERLLVEGATFEDVCESVNERGAPITLQAIQNLYRGNLELQKRRIEFQVERARMLTEALADPDSADAQLAHAAMLTGLQSLSRKDGGISLKDAVKATLERRNILLKRDLLRMRIAREVEDKRFRKTRLHAEILKMRLTREKLLQLQRELRKPENSSTLGPVAMEKIQEIYGLLQIPVIPRDVEVAKSCDE
jgi:hypothetical protein